MSTAANNGVGERCLKGTADGKPILLKIDILTIICINGLKFHKVWVNIYMVC